MCSERTVEDLIIPAKSHCVYTSCYCEENVWHLAKRILETNKNVLDLKCYAVFVSNFDKCVPLWKQKSSLQDKGLVFWDYHVFLIIHHLNKTSVLDLDTTLSFPVPFLEYVEEAIKDDILDLKFKRYFRIIEAKEYLLKFSSDRRHMLKENTNQWMSPPPSYSPILNNDKQHNLDSFISMDTSNEFGQVLNLEEFKFKFSCSN